MMYRGNVAKTSRTFAMLQMPSVWQAFGNLFNLQGRSLLQTNYTGNGSLDDYRALRADWGAVGDDMRHAMMDIRTEITNPNGQTK